MPRKARNNFIDPRTSAMLRVGAGRIVATTVLTVSGAAGLLSLVSPAALAQAPVVEDAFSNNSLSQNNATTGKRAFDILRGQNKPGPYTLSWNGLRTSLNDAPIVVNVDGKDLTPDAYTIDPTKGLITFKDPLKDTSLARVEYTYDPLFSHPNADAAANAAPVTLPVTQLSGDTSLQLSALTSKGGAGGTDSAKLVLGMGNKTRMFGGGLTSQLYFGDGANGKSDFLDRTGMKLGYSAGNTKNGLDASFQRAGGGFAPTSGKAFGMADAKQDWSLATRMTPLKWMGASYTLGESANLLAKGGTSQNGLNLKFGGVRATDPLLNYQNTNNLQIDAAGNKIRSDVDKADLTTKLASTLGFSAKTSLTKTNGTDNSKDATVQDSALTFDSKNAKGNISQATLSLTNGLTRNAGGLESRDGVSLQLQPAQTLGLSVAQTDKTIAPTGATGSTNVQETTFALNSKNVKGNNTQASLSVTDGTQKSPDAVQSHQAVTVKLQPASKVTLTVAQSQQVVDPITTAVAKSNQEQMTLGAEITPAPNTKLSGSVQQGVTNDIRTSATNVDAQFNLSKAIAVTGGITDRAVRQNAVAGQYGQPAALSDLDTTRVNLSVQTAPGVSLTTGLTMNPVDKNGVISQAQQQNIGLTLKQGAWNVGSGYAVTTLQGASALDTRGLALQTGEMSLTVGLRLSPLSNLSWGYKNDFLYGNTNPAVILGPRGVEAYTLNYTHSIGQSLNFTLGGSVTDDRSKVNQPQNIQAQAKLGLKF